MMTRNLGAHMQGIHLFYLIHYLSLLPSLRFWLPPCPSILMTFVSLVAYFPLSVCGVYSA